MQVIFVDIETTGLDPTRDIILEVAAVAVDNALNPVSGFAAVIHRPKTDTFPRADAYVQAMHTDNGLWSACESSEISLVQATDAACEWLSQWPGKLTLAGDSVHFDLGFLRQSMPRVSDRFSHRLLDVSAFRVAREILGMPGADFGASAHRAQGDVLASVAKCRYHLSRLVP